MAATELSNDEIRRYSRHLILPEVGLAGQRKFRAARVLCLGAGALGSPAILYLAAAGIGRLGIVDFDAVDLSNLQRQILHTTTDVARPKTQSAREAVQALNPHVEVILHEAALTRDNALDTIGGYDVVIDGTDNFATRYLANDACALLKKPYLYGAIYRFEGQASVFAPHLGGPCYRCLFPEPPPPGLTPGCAEGGVLGVLPGIIGCIQAAEALKLVLGKGTPLLGRLLICQALEMRFKEISVRRDPKCPLCGEHPSISELIDYEQFCGGGRTQASPTEPAVEEVTVQEMRRALTEPALGIRVLDVREAGEHELAPIAGAEWWPFSLLPARCAELSPDQTLYLFCRTGARSRRAAQFLKERGFRSVRNVRGGLNAWSDEVDPIAIRF